mmetsp:Transcript_52940/g.154081  ORF Transcript_52940/g.154081 Transcript_52940/m.154081 type:complete len:116 (-) Transcript_52940:47-394(-)
MAHHDKLLRAHDDENIGCRIQDAGIAIGGLLTIRPKVPRGCTLGPIMRVEPPYRVHQAEWFLNVDEVSVSLLPPSIRGAAVAVAVAVAVAMAVPMAMAAAVARAMVVAVSKQFLT